VHEERRDNDCNYLLLDVSIGMSRYILGSIYGPNHDDQVSFYNRLQKDCIDLAGANGVNGRNIILGGDFNATWDSSRVNSNLDIVNMVEIPSRIRSNRIIELANELGLVEPYRAINPNKREYTFIPSAINSTNRSRIDFFLLSKELLSMVTQCEIPHSLVSTLFDHKQIFLNIGKRKIPSQHIIKDAILKDVDLKYHVQSGIIETYLHHSVITPEFTVTDKERLLRMIGNIMGTLEEIRNRELRLADTGQNDGEAIQIEGLRAEVRLLFEDMPELTFFENLSLSCSDDVFFEIIANAVRNNTMAHQSTIYAIKNARKLRLTNNIKDLKEHFNANSREILILERELSTMEENERKVELEHYRLFSTLNAER
jgi:hypothetical protein